MLPCKMAEIASNMALFGLLKMLRGSQLTELERQVIAAVSSSLSSAATEIFEAQMSLVNFIQRHSSGKEVNLYPMRRGKPVYDERILFPLRTESLLATVDLIIIGKEHSLRAEILLVEGWVFSLSFNLPPGKTLENNIHINNVRIWCDPMSTTSTGSGSEVKRREESLAKCHSKFPEEYLRLVGDGEGITVRDWAVLGIHRVRKVVQPEGNYYLLAEKAGLGAVGIKEDDYSGQVYYLDYEGGDGETIRVSLQTFFEEFDGGKIIGRF